MDLGCIGWVGFAWLPLGWLALGWVGFNFHCIGFSLHCLFGGLLFTLAQVGFGLWIFTKLALTQVGFGLNQLWVGLFFLLAWLWAGLAWARLVFGPS